MQPLDPRRPENVGSSESPALFSITWDEGEAPDSLRPFETRFQLWHRKKGRIPEPDIAGDRVFWGKHLEPGIAAGLAEKTGWELQPSGFVLHPEVKGMSATPDYLARGIDGRADLQADIEVKNVDRLEFMRWPERTEDGVFWLRDGEWRPAPIQPPFRVKLQNQHQLGCTERPVGIIAPLVGGNELFVFRINRHPGVIDRIEREVVDFWRSIEADQPPPPNWSLDAETISAIWGDAEEGKVVDLRGDKVANSLVGRYVRFREVGKRAETRRKATKAQLLTMLGDASKALLDDGFAISAGTVAGCEIAYFRDPYRDFRVTQSKKRR